MVRSLEAAIKNNLKVVEETYPELDLLGPLDRSKERIRLGTHVQRIESDLKSLLDFIERLGLDLDDHYSFCKALDNAP